MSGIYRVRLQGGGQIDDALRHYNGPLDLEPPAIAGARAPDSPIVRHTGDRLPTSFGYTITGRLQEATAVELEALYFKLKRELLLADRLYRNGRYLNVAYGLLGSGPFERFELGTDVPIVFAVSDLRWYDTETEEVL